MLFNDSRLLFFDHHHLESAQDVTLTLNPPAKRGACLLTEKEWELGGVRGDCIVQVGGTYRFYYKVSLGEQGTAFAIATSADGVTWARPELGVVAFKGSSANNLVDVDGQQPGEVCVFVDPTGPQEHRFKAVGHNAAEGGMYLLTSPDGFRFKRAPGLLLNSICDNHNTSFHDERIGKYVTYLRSWDRSWHIPPMEGSRVVSRAETDDLFRPIPIDEKAPDPWPPARKWEETEQAGLRKINRELPMAMRCDEQDPPEADLYQAAAVHYLREAYVAFPTLYYHHPWAPEGFVNDGILDLQFASSRDGIAWRRDLRDPYVRLDLPDGPCTKLMHMLVGMVPQGHYLSQYYVGGRRSHGQGRVTGDTKVPRRPPSVGDPIAYRLEQRLDGFVSADSAYTGGELVTTPFVLTGKELALNVDTSASGVARAALLGEDGSAIPGYGLEDCDRIQGNDTRYMVSWRKQSDLSALTGKRVKLVVKSRSTKLFAVYV